VDGPQGGVAAAYLVEHRVTEETSAGDSGWNHRLSSATIEPVIITAAIVVLMAIAFMLIWIVISL
jgi:hypothetical protein